MSNRRISANIRKIFDIISIMEGRKQDGVICSIDFEKAFDKLEFQAIFGALEYFGYGPNLINMVKTTYTGFTASVQNNGFFSAKISIDRGVHQGGPNSSFLFLLCAELLAIKLRSNDNIQGIPVNDIEYLLGQYADDMDSYLQGTASTMRNFFQDLEWFRKLSGFSVNYDKTSVYRIGSLKDSDAVYYTEKKVKWTNNLINILGVWVSHDQLAELNYSEILDKTKSNITKMEQTQSQSDRESSNNQYINCIIMHV